MQQESLKLRALWVVGFVGLVAIVMLLFGYGMVESLMRTVMESLVFGLVLLGLVWGIISEGRVTVASREFRVSYELSDFFDFLSVLGAAIITYFVSVNLQQGAVVASGMVGVLGALVLRKYAVPIFCGSFVGMAAPTIFYSYPCMMLSGTIAGLLYVLSKSLFNGFGGKLGTIAFAGCLVASLIIGAPLASFPVPGWDIGWIIVLYSVAGAVVTYILSIRFGHGPVLASGFVGVVAGLVLPVIHGEALGTMLAVMVFCASFAGMSSRARLRHEGFVALAGVFSGLVFIFTSPYLNGAGGKLGTIAFGSSIAVWGLEYWRARIRKIQKQEVTV